MEKPLTNKTASSLSWKSASLIAKGGFFTFVEKPLTNKTASSLRGKAVLSLLERRTGVEPAKTGLGSRRNTVIRPPRESRFNRDVSVITKSGGFVNFLPPTTPQRVFQTVCTPPQRRKKRRRAALAAEMNPRCKPRRRSFGNSGIFRRK